jgi:5-methylcytosine-specific restriction endonuclease McrA
MIALRAQSNTHGEMLPCPICGTDFWVTQGKARSRQTPTCSEPCQHVAHSRKMAARGVIITRPCEVCGAAFDARPSEINHGRRTCSRACSYRLRMSERPPTPKRTTDEHQRARRRRKNIAYRARHREALNQRQSAYIKAHPEIAYVAQERRRARKAAAPINDLTRKQWRAIKAAFGNRCAYCGEHFERLTMDHIIALSKGGSHTAGNVVPACRSCNCRKWTYHIIPTFMPDDPDYLLTIV